MPPRTSADVKKLLVGAGFEVYRTLEDRVVVADRVRDNLILDSGVAVVIEPLGVRFTCRAQATEFPGETADGLFGIARRLGGPAAGRGFTEVSAAASPVRDPGDKAHVLDTWYEVAFERGAVTDEELVDLLRYALALAKTASNKPA